MRKSNFKDPKIVLVFNGAQKLIAIVRSLHSVSQLTDGNLQAISFACTGKYISTGGFYYRHVHPEVIIEISDLGTLDLQEYDKMCNEKKRYHSVREMAKRKRNKVKTQPNNKNKKEEK